MRRRHRWRLVEPKLTRRELEILRLVSEGRSNRQVGEVLWVTDQTVKFHLANVYRKLGVRQPLRRRTVGAGARRARRRRAAEVVAIGDATGTHGNGHAGTTNGNGHGTTRAAPASAPPAG